MKPTKTRNDGTWTEARYRSFITSTLRRASMRWGPRNAAKRRSRYHEKLPGPTGRLVFHSVCDECGDLVPETTSKVDHIDPIVDPTQGFIDWDTWIERFLCEIDGFQTMCRPCHDIKTKKERAIATDRKRRERALTQS